MVIPLFLGYLVKKIPWMTFILVAANVFLYFHWKPDLDASSVDFNKAYKENNGFVIMENAFMEKCTQKFLIKDCYLYVNPKLEYQFAKFYEDPKNVNEPIDMKVKREGYPDIIFQVTIDDIYPKELKFENVKSKYDYKAISKNYYVYFKWYFSKYRHAYDRDKMFHSVAKLDDTTMVYLKYEKDQKMLELLNQQNGLILKKYQWLSKININEVSVFKALFTHGNLSHLIGNMVLLFVLGMYVEIKLGGFVFGLLYASIGILSSLLTVYFNGPLQYTIGASGAIFGVTALYYSLFFKDYLRLKVFLFFKSRDVYVQNSIWFPVIFMLAELAQGVGGEYWHENGVSHLCHAAGLFIGFLIGFAYDAYSRDGLPEGFHFQYQLQSWFKKIEAKSIEGMLMEVKTQLQKNPNNFIIRESFFKRYFVMDHYLKNPYHQTLVYSLGKEILSHEFSHRRFDKVCWLMEGFVKQGIADDVIALLDPNLMLSMGDKLIAIKKPVEAEFFYNCYVTNYQNSAILPKVMETVRKVRSHIALSERAAGQAA